MQKRGDFRRLSSTAFLLTGVGVVLPGALMPALLRQWQLSDRRGGALMLASWGASTLSSLVVRKRPQRLAVYGLGMTALALFGLSVANSAAALPLFVLYGSGLGVAMTAISIARSREVEEADCSRELNRLNMLWAIGGCLTPAIALRSLHTIRVGTTFTTIGCCFAVIAAAMVLLAGRREAATPPPELPAMARVPFRFCLFAALAVGAESCVGGWLTTYVRREGHVAGVAALANTLFWTGLLLSRAAHAQRAMRWLRTQAGLGLHLLTVSVASILLLTSFRAAGLLTASALAGLGLGPLYPTVLAVSLPRFRSNLVFLCAGIGSALLPWLVGTVSTAAGSLHTGLWILCAVVAALLFAAVPLRQNLSAH